MLYDIEDENEEFEPNEEQLNKAHLRKKTIICGMIVLGCVVVMIISTWLSLKIKNGGFENSKKAEKTSDLRAYEGKHELIKKHDLEQIKTKFIPKQNPNAQQEITNIYYSKEKVAYLTFDDGPSKNITPQILDILKEENVPATFFVLGSRVELNPALLKREYEEGHYIANHGYSHKYSQIYQSKEAVLDEYNKCETAIRNALGNAAYNTYLFRFPGGSSGGKYDAIKAEAKGLLSSNGVNYTNWNCLTGDAEGKTTEEELMGCLKQSMEGDDAIIVLMHDASDKSYTAETLPAVIAYLREQGYVFKNFYGIF